MFFACSENVELKKVPCEERGRVTDALNSKRNADFHYIIFSDETGAFSPPLSFLINYIDGGDIYPICGEVIKAVAERKDVCSLYPKVRLTVCPLENNAGGNGSPSVLSDIGKRFDDILYLNDKVLKTRYIYADFYMASKDLDKESLLGHLKFLVENSKVLKAIYIYGLQLADTDDHDQLYVLAKESFFAETDSVDAIKSLISDDDLHDINKLKEIAKDMSEYEYFSIAMLQRKYRMGFHKAAKLLDNLLKERLVKAEKKESGVGYRFTSRI